MYAFIEGEVCEKAAGSLVLLAAGVGWQLICSNTTLQAAPPLGQKMRCHTFLSVREDAMQLFGFLSKDDLEMFRLLLGVSGIGPRGALGILSVLNADDLRFAVLSDDAAGISKAPGIGKKTAQKVILELKDKLDLADAFEKKQEHAQQGSVKETGTESEAVMALTALGYSNSEAFRAVRSAEEKEPGTDTEGLIRLALKELYR